MKKPLILVTNDDGITAPGVKALVEVASQLGEVVVIAPDSPQSGMGHAITVNNPIRIDKSEVFGEIKAFTCSGTPVDCVKVGIFHILKRKPDLIVSGINHGSNAATNVIYSGTMSAAVEGAMENIPSIGFSLDDFDHDADFEPTKHFAKLIMKKALSNDFPISTCLNVNVPKLPLKTLKGVKICRQAMAFWEDRFDERKDPLGKKYYWLTGEFKDQEGADDTDMSAIKNGFVSVVPVQFDMTAHHAIPQLKKWKL
jgi:5'-nucleotidase|tara:strand:+ start:6419 stop:7183 length:765 start_codon:yes stop_codon:yes gene_type:complete